MRRGTAVRVVWLGVLCGIAFLATPCLHADQVATTPDGKKVILKADGTWQYATQSDLVAAKLLEGGGDGAGKAAATAPSMVDVMKTDPDCNFRSVRWGMRSAEVKTAEGAKLVQAAKDSLVYEQSMFGFDTKIVYRFADDKLAKTRYVIDQPHVDPAKFLADYERLKQHMQPLYGRPVSEENIWKNPMYRDDRSKWGFAISIGFLSRKTVWQGKESKIVLTITGSRHEIQTTIDYTAISP